MAVVKPFRGVRYNPARFDSLQVVVAQPYDRITEKLQEEYYTLSPHNIARIIQGQAHDGDQPTNPGGPNVYTRGRAYFDEWQADGALVREDQPAFYAYELIFSVDGQQFSRLGLIAAVQLVEFDEGIILPHERTHSGPKEDRLRLLTALEANTEQIFILYPDAENKVNALIRGAIGDRAPDIDVREIWEDDVTQRVWIITDPDVLAKIEARLAPMRNLIIADGHHRYATSLTYAKQQREQYPNAPDNAAFNFLQATLVSMDDPGLVVLPTHREICNFTGTAPADILARSAEHFTVKPVADLTACLNAVNAGVNSHTYGFYGGADVGFHVLTLKSTELVEQLITDDHSREWKSLAVSVLHKILLEQVAEVPAHGIEDKTMIRYHRDPQLPVDNINAGNGNFVFFVRPTRMDNIKAVAAQGEKMPQKSTDFYPKVISGLTMLPLNPDETL
ncbi:MAG: DUF1015 domain-containing protein [Chloroflexi bacterium]|nr:DUF1015 domain-containing protein [Chloroflexota bacterium]